MMKFRDLVEEEKKKVMGRFDSRAKSLKPFNIGAAVRIKDHDSKKTKDLLPVSTL